nr:MAG TPA: hypothetical protein [Caudoviricetes sp.]
MRINGLCNGFLLVIIDTCSFRDLANVGLTLKIYLSMTINTA